MSNTWQVEKLLLGLSKVQKIWGLQSQKLEFLVWVPRKAYKLQLIRSWRKFIMGIKGPENYNSHWEKNNIREMMIINERPIWITRNYIRFSDVWAQTWMNVTKFIERERKKMVKKKNFLRKQILKETE